MYMLLAPILDLSWSIANKNSVVVLKNTNCTYCILTRSMVYSYNYNFVIVIDLFYLSLYFEDV